MQAWPDPEDACAMCACTANPVKLHKRPAVPHVCDASSSLAVVSVQVLFAVKAACDHIW